MGDCCTCFCGSQGGSAGVGKKVQYLDGTMGILNDLRKPVPIDGLFRKKTGVLETEGLQMEGQGFVMNAPFVWKVKELPLTATLAATVIVSVQRFSFFYLPWCIPDDLRIGAQKNVFSPPLQFFPP